VDTTLNTTPTSLSQKITELLQKRPVILQLLRFGAIGVFNTAIDALVLNFLAAQFGIHKGTGIGWVNFPGFALAVVQSYYWNKYWAFGSESGVSVLKNFLRLVAVGFVGVVVYGLLIVGAHSAARPVYFLSVFAVFVIAQMVLWFSFGFFKQQANDRVQRFLSFFLVSAVGFLINSAVLYAVTTYFTISSNSGDNLNLGKILATGASLVWNFAGYKVFVFKK
jgi:putative flippase GtrA